MPNEIPRPYQLDNPFTILGLLGSNFQLYSNFKSIFCKQTVQNLIRCRDLWHLIWFCTVCQCTIKHEMLKWGKRSVDQSLRCLPVQNCLTMHRLRRTNAQTMYRQSWSQNRIEQNRSEPQSPYHADNPDLNFSNTL